MHRSTSSAWVEGLNVLLILQLFDYALSKLCSVYLSPPLCFASLLFHSLFPLIVPTHRMQSWNPFVLRTTFWQWRPITPSSSMNPSRECSCSVESDASSCRSVHHQMDEWTIRLPGHRVNYPALHSMPYAPIDQK